MQARLSLKFEESQVEILIGEYRFWLLNQAPSEVSLSTSFCQTKSRQMETLWDNQPNRKKILGSHAKEWIIAIRVQPEAYVQILTH